MEDLQRVFFHELGHMVAHEINKKHFNGTGTKSIQIQPADHTSSLFIGEAKVHLSADGKERNVPTKEKLAVYLASSTYGCIFQAYFKNESLKNCFDINGWDDSEKWLSCLREHKIDDYKSEVFAAEKDYFNLINEQKSLDDLMKLKPENYLVKVGVGYDVNTDQLRSDIATFVEKHSTVYRELINRYNGIIAKYLS